MLSTPHNWREVMPGLCMMMDRMEKSTCRRSYTAMRLVKSSMTLSDARVAL